MSQISVLQSNHDHIFDLPAGRTWHQRHDPSFRKRCVVLESAIDHLSRIASDWDDHETDVKSRTLRILARAGKQAFEALVHQDTADRELQLDSLRNSLSSSQILRVLPDCTIHWEFFYLGKNTDNPTLDEFLGASMNVIRKLGAAYASHDSVDDTDIQISGTVDSIYLADSWLHQRPSENIEIVIAQDMNLRSASTGTEKRAVESTGFKTKDVPVLRQGNVGDYSIFSEALGTSEILSHFNCHAERAGAKDGREVPAKLYVTDTFAITKTDLGNVNFKARSIVVLSLCHGGQLDEFRNESLAAAFKGKEVSAVISATNRVPDAFASLWARTFYTALFEGKSVGQALFSARKRIVNDRENPAALLYVIFGDPDATIPPPVQNAA